MLKLPGMKRILIFGAGRSAYFTIHYLIEKAAAKGWAITIADSSAENIRTSVGSIGSIAGAATELIDVNDAQARMTLIGRQDIVISLLPARFHILVAYDCLALGVHLITPSYITPELQAMDADVKAKGLLFLNELGLDPGIDHMSAMHIIDRLHNNGAHISSFKSYCGGLIAKEDDTNPWHYKFSWNPYNVVRAGQDGGLCKVNGRLKYLPYGRLFAETEIMPAGKEILEGYYNRNSLHYIDLYGLQETATFVRGTLRYPGFCAAWNRLIQLGLTSDRIPVELPAPLSWQEYIKIFMPEGINNVYALLASEEEREAFAWLLEDAGAVGLKAATPAEALQLLLERKWRMEKGDRDRVVMVHEFEYTSEGRQFRLRSWMDMTGEDASRTAMAKTVGLPLALAAALIAEDGIPTRGVVLPTLKPVYEPLLKALESFGIYFTEEEILLS